MIGYSATAARVGWTLSGNGWTVGSNTATIRSPNIFAELIVGGRSSLGAAMTAACSRPCRTMSSRGACSGGPRQRRYRYRGGTSSAIRPGASGSSCIPRRRRCRFATHRAAGRRGPRIRTWRPQRPADIAGRRATAAATVGEHCTALGTVEKRFTEFALERLDLGADGRLGDKAPLRRAGERLLLGHRDEILQPT